VPLLIYWKKFVDGSFNHQKPIGLCPSPLDRAQSKNCETLKTGMPVFEDLAIDPLKNEKPEKAQNWRRRTPGLFLRVQGCRSLRGDLRR